MAPHPPRVVPPDRPLHRLAFVARFVRNPLSVVPRAAYEEDFTAVPNAPIYWVTGPQFIRAVLLEERDKFAKLAQIRLLGPLLGKGILTSEGADWKWQRQASAPMFRPQELVHFVPGFVQATRRLMARWTDNAVRPIERDMTQVTFDVISATLLPSADAGMPAAIEDSTASFQRAGAWGQLFAWVHAPRWLPQPGRRRSAAAVAALRGAVHRIVAERRAAGEAKDDLLARLMRARDPDTGQQMNDEQLVDNLLTFYLAGHETTAKALTWTLYLLARYPHWARRLEAEVGAVTGGAEVSAAHAERLPLVQQVLKESMRLYPPVPIMTRQAVADTVLDGHAIRAGASLVMPIYVIHRHARRWEEPDAFLPERFAPEREDAIPRYQYMPFGAGPRICIGMAFAMIEATVILATLLQRVRFAPAGRDPEPVARVTLIPRGGMPLAVRFRP
ncbi:MAG: cytochrome P450 [Betaproteobacteria bacterium]|nr:cytochrome P450 [Betaproteobacteria bacterium]MDH5222147.1 cytochrome P450 [Betaproteobacteria bacterium]MDH5352672.1 cytochrome P450 [Betaproteobacteria bacterium]